MGICAVPVSYTHLDVYKRQVLKSPGNILVRRHMRLHLLTLGAPEEDLAFLRVIDCLLYTSRCV